MCDTFTCQAVLLSLSLGFSGASVCWGFAHAWLIIGHSKLVVSRKVSLSHDVLVVLAPAATGMHMPCWPNQISLFSMLFSQTDPLCWHSTRFVHSKQHIWPAVGWPLFESAALAAVKQMSWLDRVLGVIQLLHASGWGASAASLGSAYCSLAPRDVEGHNGAAVDGVCWPSWHGVDRFCWARLRSASVSVWAGSVSRLP